MRKRDLSLDFVRVVSCILIVVTHILQSYGNYFAFWTNSAVCTFFLISGILQGRKQIDQPRQWLKRRIARIMVSYYVVVIPMIIVFFLFFKITLEQMAIILTNTTAFFYVPSGFRHLWYLTGIVMAYIFTPLLLVRKSWVSYGVVILLLIGLFISGIINFDLLAGLICYVTGMYFRSNLLKYNKYLFATLFIALVLFLGINLYWPSSEVLKAIRYPFIGLAIFYLIYHSQIIKKIIDSCDHVILWLSTLSYPIYLVHGFFTQGPLDVLKITKFNFINIGILVLIILGLSYIVYWITNLITKKYILKQG